MPVDYTDLDNVISQAAQAFTKSGTDVITSWMDEDDDPLEERLEMWGGDYFDGEIPEPIIKSPNATGNPELGQIQEQNPQLAQSLRQLEPGSFDRWTNKYDNGDIPQDALKRIAPGHYLRADAAQAFRAMRRAARKDGVRITLTDSYRDFATQVALARPVSEGGKGLYSEGGLAAVPGTSEHGWGLAVDVGEGREWLAKNADRFGFEGIPREDWHFQFNGDYDATVSAFNTPRRKNKKKDTTGDLPSARELALGRGDQMSRAMWGVVNEAAGEPNPLKDDKTEGGSVKAQLRQGFLDAGRPDLARMVGTEAFDTWMRRESGWDPQNVSPANNQGKANGGLFQFWFGHAFTDGYVKGGKFTMSVADQAYIAATQFNLTPERIKAFAAQIRSGSYLGWS